MRRTSRYLAWMVGTALVCLFALSSVALADRLPTSGAFNGLVIDYSISGVAIETTEDVEGFTTSRTITGKVTGKRIEVSGSVGASAGWSAALSVTVSAGENSDTLSAKSPPNEHGLGPDPWSESFSVGVDVPKGASGSVSIVLSGEYNAGGRALAVNGSFEGKGGAAAAATTTSLSAGGGTGKKPGRPADKVPGPARWWEWLVGTLVPGLAAGGLSLAGGLFGGGGAPPPRPGPLGGSPLPPRALHGQEALEWLRRRGLVAQTPDGRWVKIGDWDNATAPGSGMKGYVKGARSIPGVVDTEMVIFVEGGSAPAPYVSPGGYGPDAASLQGPTDPGGRPEPPTGAGATGVGPDKAPKPPGAPSPKDVPPSEGAAPPEGEGVAPPEGAPPPEPPREPGGAEPPTAPALPEGATVGEQPSTAEPGASRGPGVGATEQSAEPASDELPPQFAPGTRRTVDDANEALTEIKDSVERITDTIESAKDALDGIVEKADELGLTDEHKAVVEGLVDRIRKPLKEFQEKLEDKLEPLTEGIESAQESYDEVKDLLERTDRVVKVYKETYENLPDYLTEGSKVAISSYAAAFQATGETIDHHIRSIPGIGPQIADALQKGGISPRDVGTESGKALRTAVKNVTAHEARVQNEVDPILQKLKDGFVRVEDLPKDEQDILAMSGRDPYKLRDLAIKSQEMEWAIERGDMEYIRRNDPGLFEEMENARMRSFHPPSGTYEEPSALTRTLVRIINLFG